MSLGEFVIIFVSIMFGYNKFLKWFQKKESTPHYHWKGICQVGYKSWITKSYIPSNITQNDVVTQFRSDYANIVPGWDIKTGRMDKKEIIDFLVYKYFPDAIELHGPFDDSMETVYYIY